MEAGHGEPAYAGAWEVTSCWMSMRGAPPLRVSPLSSGLSKRSSLVRTPWNISASLSNGSVCGGTAVWRALAALAFAFGLGAL
eukprot:1328171-Amphidinium_carterae.1